MKPDNSTVQQTDNSAAISSMARVTGGCKADEPQTLISTDNPNRPFYGITNYSKYQLSASNPSYNADEKLNQNRVLQQTEKKDRSNVRSQNLDNYYYKSKSEHTDYIHARPDYTFRKGSNIAYSNGAGLL